MGQPVVHFDIGCRDADDSANFYGEMFGWSSAEYGPQARSFDTGSERGIQGFTTALGHEPFNYVMIYVEVDDVAASAAQAEELGGKILVPPIDIPTGTFCWVADPSGNRVGLWRPADQS